MNGDLTLSQTTTNSNIAPYQQLALFARDDELSINERFDLVAASILLGGHQVGQMCDNNRQIGMLNQQEIESLKSKITKYEARDQKKINEILDRAIADYQSRGHGCSVGGGIAGALGVTSLFLGPLALFAIPAIGMTKAAVDGAKQEYGFEQKLREAKKNGDFKNVNPDDLPKLIKKMKEEHNREEAIKRTGLTEEEYDALPSNNDSELHY